MSKRVLYISLVLFIFLLSLVKIQAQKNNYTEASMITEAESLFAQKKWEEALPLYAHLVSVYPEKADYNYKLGICTLYGDRSNQRICIRYLKKAYEGMKDDIYLPYYLGMAYYQNQEYENAIQFFEVFKAKSDVNSPKHKEVFNLIIACQNGLDLIHTNRIADVLSDKEFQKSNFHRAYPVAEINGALVQKPDQFFADKENRYGYNRFVYIPANRGVLYFSGIDPINNNRDIYTVTYDENGNWNAPEKLKGDVNTFYDEDFPVITDEGKTLYFCSKGHNSLGGYDIFKSTFDTISQSFTTPQNMGNGINSAFDDFLYIPDKTGQFAFFASNRESINDEVHVYKIRLMTDEEFDQYRIAASKIDISERDDLMVTNNPTNKDDGLETQLANESKQTVRTYNQIDPVISNERGNLISMSDEELEINNNIDENVLKEPDVKVYDVVQSIAHEETDNNVAAIDEELEVNLTENKTLSTEATVQNESIAPVYNVAETVQYKEPDNSLTFSDEDLEVRKSVDNTAINQVSNETMIAQTSQNNTLKPSTENSSIDAKIKLEDSDPLIEKNQLTFSSVKTIDQKSIQIPGQIKEATFEDQTINELSTVNYKSDNNYNRICEIKTDKTHHELIVLARSNPEILSYDELLLAADLIPSPYEKIALYRSAFIRVERDSRAYDNASFVANEIVKKGEATVYKYQAQLLLESILKSGKIEKRQMAVSN